MNTHTFTIPVYGEISVNVTRTEGFSGDAWERKAERMSHDLLELHDCVDSAEAEIEDGHCDWTDDSFEYELASFELHVSPEAHEPEEPDFGIFHSEHFDRTLVPRGWYHVQRDDSIARFANDEEAARHHFKRVAYFHARTEQICEMPACFMELVPCFDGALMEKTYPWHLIASDPRTQAAREMVLQWEDTYATCENPAQPSSAANAEKS